MGYSFRTPPTSALSMPKAPIMRLIKFVYSYWYASRFYISFLWYSTAGHHRPLEERKKPPTKRTCNTLCEWLVYFGLISTRKEDGIAAVCLYVRCVKWYFWHTTLPFFRKIITIHNNCIIKLWNFQVFIGNLCLYLIVFWGIGDFSPRCLICAWFVTAHPHPMAVGRLQPSAAHPSGIRKRRRRAQWCCASRWCSPRTFQVFLSAFSVSIPSKSSRFRTTSFKISFSRLSPRVHCSKGDTFPYHSSLMISIFLYLLSAHNNTTEGGGSPDLFWNNFNFFAGRFLWLLHRKICILSRGLAIVSNVCYTIGRENDKMLSRLCARILVENGSDHTFDHLRVRTTWT